MPLLLYLIGARGSGKTAVFNALIQTPQGPYFAAKGPHRLGTIKVPDERLDALATLYHPRKLTAAEVTFVDVGFPGGAEMADFRTLQAFLGEADAFALVVPAFGETDAQGQAPDPTPQMDSILLDLIMADLEKIERRLQKVEQEKQRGLKGSLAEIPLLQKCKHALEAGRPLRLLDLSVEEKKRISSFQFLSQKPLLVIANTGEKDPSGQGADKLREACRLQGLTLLAFCAPLEAEIAALPPADQSEFLKNYGLQEPARIRLLQAAYRVLNLISFFTVGEDEVRAWTLHQGDNALAAAAKIHTDLARGFIRAETVEASLLLEKKSLAACREAGKLRLEGKDYVVKDGDVIFIRANA